VTKGKRAVFLVAGTLGLVVFAGGLYLAYSYFFTEEAPAPAVNKSPAAPVAAKVPATPTPAPAPQAPAASSPVARARETTESRAMAVAETTAPVAAATTEAPAAAPAPKAAETATARTTIAKGVTATTTLEQAAADASVEFRTFVANAKISGVFQGTPARAVINGRLSRSGETIDTPLGIVFDRIDADRRHIVFRDRTGATVTRRY
jgi:hypothetical protein